MADTRATIAERYGIVEGDRLKIDGRPARTIRVQQLDYYRPNGESEFYVLARFADGRVTILGLEDYAAAKAAAS